MDSNLKNKKGVLAGIVSILVNVALFALKYWAGIVSGSVALLADAWHTLSDSLTSIVVIAGVRLAGKKADREHPFGHGRWEQIASIFIGFILAIVAYEFIREAYDKFRSHEAADYGMIAIVVTIISILVKEGLSQYALYIYRKTELSTLRADAWHHRSDALSSVIILVGIFLKKWFWWIDSLLAVIVSLILFWAVYDIIKKAIFSLLGEVPSSELISRITAIAERTTGTDMHLHHFHIHVYGSHKELTFHIRVPDETNIKEAHRIANKIEKNILKELDIQATIHAEPIERSDHF